MAAALNELLLLHHDLRRHDNIRRLIGVEYETGVGQYEAWTSPYVSLGDAILAFQGCYADRVAYARAVAFGVANGLLHLHANGVVHRDLVPENVVLAAGIVPKIGGFGSCHIGVEQRVHSLVGTPEYMAPEMLTAQEASARIDWWSFGCLVHEMILGDSPFGIETSVEALIKRIVHTPIILHRLAMAEQHIVGWLLTRNPVNRLSGTAVLSNAWFDPDSGPISLTAPASITTSPPAQRLVANID